MSRVDELMVLILRYGLQKWRVGLNDNRKNPAKAEQWDDQSSETLIELRTALSACVAEWRPISEAPRDGGPVLLGSQPTDDQEAISTLGWWQDAIEDGVDYMGADAGFVDHNFSVYYPGRSFGAESHQHAGRQPTHFMHSPQPPETP